MISEINCYINHEKKLYRNAGGYHETNEGKTIIGINLETYRKEQLEDHEELDVVLLSKDMNYTFLIELLCQCFETEDLHELRRGIFRRTSKMPFKECKRCRPKRCAEYIDSEQSLAHTRMSYSLDNLLNKISLLLLIIVPFLLAPFPISRALSLGLDSKAFLWSLLAFLFENLILLILQSLIFWMLYHDYDKIVNFLVLRFDQRTKKRN